MLLFISLFVFSVACQNGITATQLASAIEDIIAQPQFDRMEWGILVEQELPDSSYQTVYSLNADQYFTPASNNKVITTAPAYLYLGDDFKYSTPFVASSSSVRFQ